MFWLYVTKDVLYEQNCLMGQRLNGVKAQVPSPTSQALPPFSRSNFSLKVKSLVSMTTKATLVFNAEKVFQPEL